MANDSVWWRPAPCAPPAWHRLAMRAPWQRWLPGEMPDVRAAGGKGMRAFLNSCSRMSVARVPSGKKSTDTPRASSSRQVARQASWLRLSTRFNRTWPALPHDDGVSHPGMTKRPLCADCGGGEAGGTGEEHGPADDGDEKVAGLGDEFEGAVQVEERVDVLCLGWKGQLRAGSGSSTDRQRLVRERARKLWWLAT